MSCAAITSSSSQGPVGGSSIPFLVVGLLLRSARYCTARVRVVLSRSFLTGSAVCTQVFAGCPGLFLFLAILSPKRLNFLSVVFIAVGYALDLGFLRENGNGLTA